MASINGDHQQLEQLLSATTEGEQQRQDAASSSSSSSSLYTRTMSNANDELWRLRRGLLWLGLQRLISPANMVLSILLFAVCTIVIPVVTVACVQCDGCDELQMHPFATLVQLSESALCAIAFTTLCAFIHSLGLRKMLLLDQIGNEPLQVQHGYHNHLQDAFKLLVMVLLPCFAVELVHKVVWFINAGLYMGIGGISISGNVARAAFCVLAMISWLYRAGCFLFMCVLFRLTCSLQILRLKAFYKLLESSLQRCSVPLREHMRIRSQMIIMSHRFRIFLISSVITITLSQISSLFIITTYSDAVSFPNVGDLAVCSAMQLMGIVLCLHGAAKISHAAQRIVSLVSKAHAVATCRDMNNLCNCSRHQAHTDVESPATPCPCANQFPTAFVASFCQRSALVDYFQHCKGSVTIYGFVVDRGSIYGIFALELSLMLWTLGKTILVHSP